MLQYFLNNVRIFNASDDLHLATAILTLLYLEADGRPLNTLFKRCAPNRTVRHRIGSLLTGLRDQHRLIYRLSRYDMAERLLTEPAVLDCLGVGKAFPVIDHPKDHYVTASKISMNIYNCDT